MLIGPTLSLVKLEEHMEQKISDNKMEMNELSKKLGKLKEELAATSKFTLDEEGDRIVNSRYVEVIEEFETGKKTLEEMVASNDFMVKRLEEIEDLANAPGNKINKETYKITLSLNDCILLGVENI